MYIGEANSPTSEMTLRSNPFATTSQCKPSGLLVFDRNLLKMDTMSLKTAKYEQKVPMFFTYTKFEDREARYQINQVKAN